MSRKRTSDVERPRFIHDGPNHFVTSCVVYTRFRNAELRQMFAYLREKEQLLERDLKRWRGTPKEGDVRARFEEVQSILIFVSANFR